MLPVTSPSSSNSLMAQVETRLPRTASESTPAIPPSVLVVLVVKDGAAWLQQCLRSLSRQTHRRIGVLAIGYADGLPHRLSNKGKVIADGKPAHILGTVSMDLTTIDLSHTQRLKPGDEVTILGQEGEARLDAQQIAKLAGTISYNILCGISARVRRVYVD